MPLTFIDKKYDPCKECYKVAFYYDEEETDFDEAFVDIELDENHNIRGGMTSEDLDHYKTFLKSPSPYPDGCPKYMSLEEVRTEESYPDALVEENISVLGPVNLGRNIGISPERAKSLYYQSCRSVRAVKARDEDRNYLLKIIKPPAVRSVCLFRRSHQVNGSAALIMRIDYVSGETPEEGFYHPAILRLDMGSETSLPTEFSYHETLIHAHADQKLDSPVNIDDNDLVKSDYYGKGLFSVYRNNSGDAGSLPDMGATVINGNLLTRDFHIFCLGTLFRSSSTHLPQ